MLHPSLVLRSPLLALTALVLATAAPCSLPAAAPLKVDFGVSGRSDSLDPRYVPWMAVGENSSATKSVGGVTFSVRATGSSSSRLAARWWKGGSQPGARMSVAGLDLEGEGALELRISGLSPGPHTLATFHNISGNQDRPQAGRLDILVNGTAQVTGLVPSLQVVSDHDAAVAYLRFEARPGEDTVVVFRPDARDTVRNIALSGFELDGPDPLRRAGKPIPADDDEHLDAGTGRFTAKWSAPASAVAYNVYFGTAQDQVGAATPQSPAFRGKVAAPETEFTGLTPHEDYYWRVDAVAADGTVTPGETWHFRARRLSFPTAEGYGRFARGGRGGRVIEVTNLADSGPGSLRAAVEAEGPRTVVFAVSGLITLQSKLVIKHPYLTVAGQTAPGKGITLRKYTFGMIGSHDVIVRHVRVRPGNISGVTLDGMGMAASDHAIYDHCSISWTIDESFSSRAARNITLQRTLISEALNEAGHRNYPAGTRHGYAASISGKIGSFHHNLLAHNSGRNWSLAGGIDQANRHTGWLDIRNNVVYNWGNRTTDGGAAKVNYVNNYYKPGPASRVFHLLMPERNNISGFGPQDYFVAGNIMEGRVGADDPLGGVIAPNPRRPRTGDFAADHDDARPTRAEPLSAFVKDEPFFDSFVATQSARTAYKVVLSDVGANLPVLDDHDARVIQETLDGTAAHKGSKTGFPGLPDSQEDVGGWENYPEEHRPANWDSDHDGMPDWWETMHRLNPRSPAGDFAETNADADGDGWTHLEDYLNWMAKPHLACRPGSSVQFEAARLTRGFTLKPVHAVTGAVNGTATLSGDTITFTPAAGFTGLASFTYKVVDAQGDSMSRTVNVRVQ